MNVLSVNIRGLGGEEKSPWIRSLRLVNEIGFIMLQETQFSSLDGMDISRFWGNGEFSYEWVGATGRSGGLLSLWDPRRFTLVSVEKHRYYLCTRGVLKETGKSITLINVYSPQKLVDKRLLWTELERIIVQDQEYWIVGGDFNCVRDRMERRKSKFIASVTNEFNDFIDKVGLHEFMLRGRKFTYVSGNKCSRIDRILVSWSVINDWPNAEYRALAREKSDHSPLILKVEVRNYGAKPFRLYNSWLLHSDLEDLVDRTVKDFSGYGPPDIVLMNKFKLLR